MQLIRKSETTKIVAGVAGLAIALFMIFGVFAAPVHGASLTSAQIDSIVNLLESFGADASVVADVRTTLEGGTPSGGTPSTGSCAFSASYSSGDSAPGVMDVQKFLNTDSATRVAASGVGSAGNETQYFGSLTKAAVIKFQDKYAADVLAPVGLSAGTGYWGPSSRAKAQSLCDGGSTGETPPAPVGSGLSVFAGSQPVATLAPQGAARVPYTNFTLTASADGAVVLNSVTVERTGLVAKAAFAGVVLLQSDGTQLGNAKTLNSNYQATIGEDVTIPAGQSRTFTVAGNMAADNSGRVGETGGLKVVAVNTSASVSGSLPVMGSTQTINSSLTIGTAVLYVSSFDPNSAQTKEIGSTGVRFAGVRVTAGSGEDIRVFSMRWNQIGSAGINDFGNLVMNVGGTEYPVTVSADGNYYSANFGAGIVVPKGNNLDIYLKGDIVSGTSRTVVFDIDKTTDFYAKGELYGYGLTPTAGATGAEATNTSTFSTDGVPFFDGSTVTISAGSATTIAKSASVPSQNIAVNVPNQPLGAFTTNFQGEPVTVSAMTLTGATTTAMVGLITSVSIVDENGTVVAGPEDATQASGVLSFAFTDSVTFPVGEHTYTIKGKLPSTAANNGTLVITVTPSGWTSPVGDTTGDSVSLSAFGAFTLNTMTVKAAALAITVSPSPVAQNVTGGVQGYTWANYMFDATQSGEDVRFSSMVGLLNGSTDGTAGAYNDMSACQMWDGDTALNYGSNVVNPAASATSTADTNTFTFNNALVIPKGTVKTLVLKCSLSSSGAANGDTYQWGIAAVDANIVVTGVTSAGAVVEGVTASNGQLMTVAAGTLVASEDSSSPGYTIVAAGSTGVNNGVINFRASNEDITLQRIGLLNTHATASSSASDVTQVTLWHGATQIGSAIFTGTNVNATSTLDTPLLLPKDSDTDITVKVDLAPIGTSQIGTQGALIAIDYAGNTNTRGVGASGTTVDSSGSTSFNGLRVFRAYPTVAKIDVPSTSLVNGVMDLYRFSIASSDSGQGIGLAEFTINMSTSSQNSVSGSTTVTLVDVYAYTDSSFSSPVTGFTNGKVITQLASIADSGDNAAALSAVLQIPKGETRYFKVTGTITMVAGTGTFSGSVTTRISGDAAYVANGTTLLMASTTNAQAEVYSNDDFIWSPNATTTSVGTHLDWANGFNVPGLPSDGSASVTLEK